METAATAKETYREQNKQQQFKRMQSFIFYFETFNGVKKQVRVVLDKKNKEIWFIAKDIFSILQEYSSSKIQEKILQRVEQPEKRVKLTCVQIRNNYVKSYIVDSVGVFQIIDKSNCSYRLKQNLKKWLKEIISEYLFGNNEYKTKVAEKSKEIIYLIWEKDGMKYYCYNYKQGKEIIRIVIIQEEIWFAVSDILKYVGLFYSDKALTILEKAEVDKEDISKVFINRKKGRYLRIINLKGLQQFLEKLFELPYAKTNNKIVKMAKKRKQLKKIILEFVIPNIGVQKSVKKSTVFSNTDNKKQVWNEINPEEGEKTIETDKEQDTQKVISISKTKEKKELPQKEQILDIKKGNKYEIVKKIDEIILSVCDLINNIKSGYYGENDILKEKESEFKTALNSFKFIQDYVFQKIDDDLFGSSFLNNTKKEEQVDDIDKKILEEIENIKFEDIAGDINI